MAAPKKNSQPTARGERTSSSGVDVDGRDLSDEAFLGALGRHVRQLRELRGLSRKALAEVARVSERYLAQLEAGSGNISIILLRRIAGSLNVRTAYLMSCEAGEQRTRLSRLVDSLPDHRIEEAIRRLTSDFGTDESVRRKRIALIGLRGAGKTTLGGALAKQLRRPFVELDHEIEREAGMALPEIFQLYGASGYRNWERQALEGIIASQNEVVVSVGGGVVSDLDTYQLLLGNCFTVWLKAAPAEHMSRVVAQGDMRPMRGHAQAMEDLKAILTAREPQYARADAVVDTSRHTVAKSLAAVRAALASS